jgi:prepilin-type N-terminal cleavage/methylation domain-containing protein
VGHRPMIRAVRDERGLTLVELLLALVILGIILAATAGALISFGQTSVLNERRVQVTAHLTRAHEQLQAIPWDELVLYDNEVSGHTDTDGVVYPGLNTVGVDLSTDPPTFGGEDLVTIAGPNDPFCEPGDVACDRLTFVPLSFEQVEIDGRPHDIFTIITEVDRTGDGLADVRRFTTIARWNVLGRSFEQLFESERAPTADEVEPPVVPSVLSYIAEPGIVGIDTATGLNEFSITLRARFSVGMDDVEVRFGVWDGTELVSTVLPLTNTIVEDGEAVGWEAVIEPGDYAFTLGEQSFILVGTRGGVESSSSRSILFVDATTLSPQPVVRGDVQVFPSTVEVGQNGKDKDRLCQTLTIEAIVDGLLPGGSVRAIDSLNQAGNQMDGPATITGTGDVFRLQFTAGQVSPWTSLPVNEVFEIVASNDDVSSSPVTTDTVNIRAVTTTNKQCP